MTKEELVEKKKAVLKKLYGGERKPYMHDFNIEDGKCNKCKVFLGKKGETLLCPVIGDEEVAKFKTGYEYIRTNE